jgi:hypothetical protein
MNMPKTVTATLYTSTNIHELVWPDTPEGAYAKPFLEPLIKDGIRKYIDNIHADMFLVQVAEFVFPVLVPLEHDENSYVCSPFHHYITNGKRNINLIPKPWLMKLLKPFMDGLEKISKKGRIDDVVYVNNWMFAIDLYPEGLEPHHINAIVELLTERFKNRTIIFRSLNAITNKSAITALKNAGFKLVASRTVYVSDISNESIFNTRIVKSDIRLCAKTPYTFVDHSELSTDDCQEFHRLRHLFSLVQHSSMQPHINPSFMELLFKEKLLKFQALKHEGQIKGVIAYHLRAGTMYCPLIAYDKSAQDQNTIYRLLNTSLLLQAKKEARYFNQSAGASVYKSLRRAEATMEFMAIYTCHLPLKQKVAWSTLKQVMNTLGTLYMKRY